MYYYAVCAYRDASIISFQVIVRHVVVKHAMYVRAQV